MRIAPVLGVSDETYGKVMTAALRVMNKLGRA
jgi:succinate-semialdehyde dehydrogenase/glutarate-semialdehyde dehydrogenase